MEKADYSDKRQKYLATKANLNDIRHAYEHPRALANQTTNFSTKIDYTNTLTSMTVPNSGYSITAARVKLVGT